jgi:hypothetical protein
VLVLLTGGEHRENTLHKATAALTLRAIAPLGPLHGMAQRAVTLSAGIAPSARGLRFPSLALPGSFLFLRSWLSRGHTPAVPQLSPLACPSSLPWHETWNFWEEVNTRC